MRLAKFDEAHCPPPDKKCPKVDTAGGIATPLSLWELELIPKFMPLT
jgi:hypothetical protein